MFCGRCRPLRASWGFRSQSVLAAVAGAASGRGRRTGPVLRIERREKPKDSNAGVLDGYGILGGLGSYNASDHSPEKNRQQLLQELRLDVLYEDADMLVVNKEAPLLCVAEHTNGDSLVKRARLYLSEGRGRAAGAKFIGLAHRLDADVTGVVVLGKSPESAKRLCDSFAERQVSKQYIGIVRRWPFASSSATTLRQMIAKDEATGLMADGEAAGKLAVLRCRPLASGPGGATAVLVQLLTGRRHQIRFQLASEICPLLGDDRYGSGKRDGSRKWIHRPALHAWQLSLQHPMRNEKLKVEAPIPPDLRDLMLGLGLRPEAVLNEASLGIDGLGAEIADF